MGFLDRLKRADAGGGTAIAAPAAPSIPPAEARERITKLTEENRRSPDLAIERELVRLRCLAFEPVPADAPPLRLPEPDPRELELVDGLPTIASEELTPAILRKGILQGGCLQIKGLIDPVKAAELAEGIELATEARDDEKPNEPSRTAPEWYSPLDLESAPELTGQREWVTSAAGCWTADSPRNLFKLVDFYSQAGVVKTITEYLGERPAVSVNKWTLRRVEPSGKEFGWHQDGQFLGERIGAVNIWLSLSHCGIDAPGLDLISQRLETILPTGTEGAPLDWTVSPKLIEERGLPITRPAFEPGDAVLFDEYSLHCTANNAEMTKNRYAVETWCFAPSAWPNDQVPLVL